MKKNINNTMHFVSKAGVLALVFTTLVLPFATHASTLTRQLQTGMSGSDVGALQSFLAQDVTMYPQGLVTNYFGFLTKSAVSNFQSRNGLPAVGRVGPATLPIINAQMNGMNIDTEMPSTIPAPQFTSHNIGINGTSATISWSTNEASKGVVYYSTSPLIASEYVNSVTISGSSIMNDANLHISQSLTLQGLQSNTRYYYMIYITNQSGIVSVSGFSTFITS